MRKALHVALHAKQVSIENPQLTQDLILEILLDIRQLLEKQNEMLRCGINVKTKEGDSK